MVAPKFGVGIPTGTEGLMYPIPFARATDNVRISVAAEEWGYDSVWGNDHLSTQRYVRREAAPAPSYYAPLIVLGAVAQATSRIRLGTALLVVPFRHPVVIAKEAATLDQLSGGRLLLGVGIGAYREEFEAMWGERASAMNRGAMLDEALAGLHALWTEDDATCRGRWFDFAGVQSYPKPVQSPMPVYIGGNSPNGRRRVARHGTGWLPAVLSPEEIRRGVEEIKAFAAETGRDLSGLDVAPQLAVALGRTREEALRTFERSQIAAHMESLRRSTLKGQPLGAYETRNLIGTPDDVLEQIARYTAAGVTTFSALLFAVDTVDEMLEAMHRFSEEVIARV